MLGWMVKRRMAAFEKDFEYDMGYARYIYDASPRGFWKFVRIMKLSEHCEGVPREPWYAAKFVATLGEDRGPCTQLVVTMAERAGVSPPTLRGILAGDEAAMGAEAALGYRFAKAVLAREIAEADQLREEIVSRWGRKAVVSLGFAIAASRVYPAVKYALGFGHACAMVRVAGANAPFLKRAAGA